MCALHESGGIGGSKVAKTLIAVAAVGLAGLGVWASWRSGQGDAREQDFDVTLICPRCGHALLTSYATMHTLPPPAAERTRASRTPITRCPSCAQADMFRAGACPKCGKPALVEVVVVDGKRVGPRCFSCDWKQP